MADDGERDVRRVLPELRARGRLTAKAVPWARFEHAYGPADDVPALLLGLLDPDEGPAAKALGDLWNKVRHQGTCSPPAALAVPFLLAAAAAPSTRRRARLVLLAAEAGHRNHFGQDLRANLFQVDEPEGELLVDGFGCPVSWTLEAARAALTADAPLLIALLDDPDAEMRANAAYALATALTPPSSVREALLARLAVEDEEPVRISLALALTQLALEQSEAGPAAAWAEALWTDADNPLDLRFAGALAWLCATGAPAPRQLLDLLAANTTPRMEDWMRRVPWPDEIARGGLAWWLVGFLGDAANDRAWLASRLTRTPHPEVTESALSAALEVAGLWRSQTDAMVELLADHLHHPELTVSRAAARHLTAVGRVSGSAADRLADALGHDDEETRVWTVVALAHSGDARAVAPLRELLQRPTCPWPNEVRWTTATYQVHGLIDSLDSHAAELLPAIRDRLASPTNAGWRAVWRDLLNGLRQWGDHASGTVATLTDLLPRLEGSQAGSVAAILGLIGPAAAGAVPALDALAGQTDPNSRGTVVWARWRITGEETAATAATLAHLATIPPHGPESLRLLADLGPAAAPHEPMIRAALAGGYDWTRAEAAHALWRATGDTAESVPVLLGLLGDRIGRAGLRPVQAAVVGYLADIGPAAHAATPVLKAFLDADRRSAGSALRSNPISWDQHCQRLAATALRHIAPAGRD